MTRLLETAIERLRELPDEVQDDLAGALMSLMNLAHSDEGLDEETRLAIAEALDQADRGEFASDIEIAAVFGRPLV
ncbi:MAG: hypothetical protein KIS96_01480 [Bauldia sp.]|nr:hypothetical protein [Bauldia sp.]